MGVELGAEPPWGRGLHRGCGLYGGVASVGGQILHGGGAPMWVEPPWGGASTGGGASMQWSPRGGGASRWAGPSWGFLWGRGPHRGCGLYGGRSPHRGVASIGGRSLHGVGGASWWSPAFPVRVCGYVRGGGGVAYRWGGGACPEWACPFPLSPAPPVGGARQIRSCGAPSPLGWSQKCW